MKTENFLDEEFGHLVSINQLRAWDEMSHLRKVILDDKNRIKVSNNQ
jgi:hypothetical protein